MESVADDAWTTAEMVRGISPGSDTRQPAPNAVEPDRRVFTPLVKAVLIIGILVIAGIYALQSLGGIEGIKDRFGSRGEPSPQPVPVAPTPGTPGALAPLPAPSPNPAPASSGPDPVVRALSVTPGGTETAEPIAQPRRLGSAAAEVDPDAEEILGYKPVPAPIPNPVFPGQGIDSNLGELSPGDLDRESIDPLVAPPAEENPTSVRTGFVPSPPDPVVEGLPGAVINLSDAVPAASIENPETAPLAIVVPGMTSEIPLPETGEVGGASALPGDEGSKTEAAEPVASPIGNDAGSSEPAGGTESRSGLPESGLPEDPGQRMAAIMEPVGSDVIRAYYESSAIDERSRYVIDSEFNQPAMEAYYRRYQEPPTLESIEFRGPMRDAASGRWFGVFDVREKENQATHRWCVVQVRPGEMKLDWNIYQQLIDQSLDRFLSDPEAAPKAFRMVIRRGEEPPSDENPWPGKTWELHLQPPLDMAQPRTLLISEAEFQRLGLDQALIGGNARIGRVELSWVPSELEPLTKIPTVTKVLGWGAW